MTRQIWIVATVAILAFACLLHNNSAEKRVLSAAEQVQADAARNEIAQVIERNLIKFFALVAASGESGKNRGPYQRQEGEETEQEDEEDPESSEAAEATEPTEAPETTTLEPTLDPTFFPQVAEILGGVFSGQLNVPGVVDKTFGLMPGTLKTQVEGLFKLLTGADYPTKAPSSTTTEATEEPPADETSTDGVKIIVETTPTPAPPTTESTTPPPTSPTPPPTTTTESYKAKLRNRYTVNRRRNRNSSTMSPDSDSLGPVILLQQDEDDTIFRLEKKIVAAAVDAEPFIRDAEPELYRRQVRGIFSNINSQVNFTEIVKILPDLFKGARQAFLLLENLGVIDGDTELSEIADIFE